jgi:flagellar hook protein FlgE
MSNYTIALSGLQNTSLAIDTTSNNIANANTVGYKAGEYVFADQFVKAVNPADTARVGMGTQSLLVRRPMLQGTITNSANPLDLAISGKGMFRLLQGTPGTGVVNENNPVNSKPNIDPSAVYYSRNGQFGVDKNGYIVNENGMYLTGFQASLDGNSITDDLIINDGLLKMPETNLPGNETTASVVSAMLDSRGSAFTSSANVSFDPTQATFNNKTSQTVFDNEGNSHTLEVYYRRISDGSLSITSGPTGYTYSPGRSSSPNTLGTTLVTINQNSVLRMDSPANASSQAASESSSTTITLTAAAANSGTEVPVAGMRVFVNGVDSGATVLTVSGTGNKTLTTTSAVLVPSGAAISFYAPNQTTTTTPFITNATSFNSPTALAGINVGDRIFVKGVDTGRTVVSVAGTLITASGAMSTTATSDPITFFKPNLNMTLMTPDGTEITVQGFGNKKNSGETLTTTMAKVEVYASLDGRFYDYNDPVSTSNRALRPQTPGVLGYKAVSELSFIGGQNIDSLVADPLSGNPLFTTKTTLSTRVTNQAGGSSDLVFDLDLSDTSLQAGAFQITHSTQNGEPLARLTNVTVDNEGRIVGVYGSGKQQFIGQIALVNFDNAEGLIPVGKNAFAASVDSGTEHSASGVNVGRAGTGVFGDIKGQALESSTVDLANELVRLMVLQRSYSANSQSMKAFDQTLRDTLQMVG